MTWAQRRQMTYLSGFLLVVGLIAFLVIRNATHVEPTCYDGKRNGDEVGIDCGGSCQFYCPLELADPKVRWVRFFSAGEGLVHAVAYIEHAYASAAIDIAPFTFRLYDKNNNILTERSGSTYVGPMGRSAIVETLIPIGNTEPTIARFSFDGPLVWQKIPVEFSQIVVKTDRFLLEQFEGGTRLTATLDNQSEVTFSSIDVVAVLYDKSDNAIAVSKTVVRNLPGRASTTTYFTWAEALKDRVARVEVIPRINPFTAY